ncbi:serine hydrolase domain-containing protein [Reyranella soli]|uniref:1,4-butanediol diacrylate esterase n=1 Tax=Reyranella soli TaxID=1230389 RepID=A0A512NJL9_9HYPH|nr:serine hydrolase domain-containing protein [Reyranella soli]GEP59149.1 1,4-butanediol diacrylate esterase [Reyranella soli]
MADSKHNQANTVTRRTAIKAGAGALLASGVPLFWPGEARADKAKIDAVLNGAVTSGDVPGVVAAAADDKGVFYEGAFGKRNLVTGTAMTPDTMFWIASMTKALTSIAAMQMVEQGKLSLDKPISDVVMELSAAQVLEGFDAEGKPKLRPPKRPITLRHLLTHTAGFSYDLWNKDIERYMKVANVPGIGTCKLEALKVPMIADPGEKWEYGINIDWAGKAVERVSGMSLDGYMRERIFTPLGMKDTGFILRPDQQARLASVHARGADGKLSPIEFGMPQAPEFFMGGGALYSTGRDYLSFLRALLGNGKLGTAQILKPETVALVNKNSMGDLNVTLLKTAQPDLTNDAEFFPGMVKKWGLAYMINTQDVPGKRSAGSLAWAGLANTYYWLDPKKKVAGVILTQILPFADTKTLQVFGDFEGAVYQNGRPPAAGAAKAG